MSTPVAVVSGLGAAGLFALGTALQYGVAHQARLKEGTDGAAGFRRVLRATVSSPRWVLGTAVLAAGLGLHALALHSGPLTLVQPILITGVLFALPTSRYVGGPVVDGSDMRWAAVLVVALAAFLVTSTPAAQASKDIDRGPALAVVVISAVGVTACLLAARRMARAAAATLLGAAAGIALAGSAALIKVCTDLATRGIGALLGGWQLYALVVVGGTGLLLSQVAFRAGPLVASLPAINTVNPLGSVVIGTAVFDERFRVGVGSVLVECLSLAVVLAATATLSRRSARDPGPVDPARSAVDLGGAHGGTGRSCARPARGGRPAEPAG